MNTEKRRADHNKVRSIEDIVGSNVARLASEAPRLIPVSYPTMHRLVRDGRLEVFGKPVCVNVGHLLEQHRRGFPVINKRRA
jgi:hypothetical protein